MFRALAFLALAIFPASLYAAAERVIVETTLPFDMATDSLCFKNGDPELANTGIPILGSLGVKKGVCQGIAGIAGAFRENVEFLPNAPVDSAAEVVASVTRALRANRKGSGERVPIRGYANLSALCRANRMTFLKKAVWLNTGIAVTDILPIYGQFRRLKKEPLSAQKRPEALRRQLAETLAEALTELREGRYPLLLYFSHVVLVRGYTEVRAADGTGRVDLDVYDSNQPKALRKISVSLARDGLPAPESTMLWVITRGRN